MKKTNLKYYSILVLILFSVLLIPNAVHAQSELIRNESIIRPIQFSLGGGYAYSEALGGMTDILAELLVSLSSVFRIGFGLGYITDSDSSHMGGNFGQFMGRGMMGSGTMNGDFRGGFASPDHSFRVVPLTVSMYYSIPVLPRLNAYILAGGGYYMGSYRDISTQKNNAFGPHLGLGGEFRIAHRLSVSVEGFYRFVNLQGFSSELHPGFMENEAVNEHEEGSWHFHHHSEDWHFHEEHEDEILRMDEFSEFNINLNGFSLRFSLRFGF